MLKFHRKVNPKEGLIGFYKTGSAIDESTLAIYQYYLTLLQDPKNKGLLVQPLLFLIDPTMQENKLSIKVSISLQQSLTNFWRVNLANFQSESVILSVPLLIERLQCKHAIIWSDNSWWWYISSIIKMEEPDCFHRVFVLWTTFSPFRVNL